MNIDQFLNHLASNNSRNFKIKELEVNRENKLLREVVRLALDPFTQFYQRKIPTYTRGAPENTITLEEGLNSLFELSERILTGNAAIDHLTNILSNLEPHDARVIERVIKKDLTCGVNTSTVNKVWAGLIVDYPVMLCSQFEQRLVDKIQYPAFVQLKEDGMRFNAIVRNGSVEFRSRNGKELHLLGNLEEEFLSMAGEVDSVFDGELLVVDSNGILDRQSGNGILNKANKGTISTEEASKVVAVVWDVIPYQYFMSGEYHRSYEERFELLNACLKKCCSDKVSIVQTDIVFDYDSANEIFERYLSSGKEGIILKSKDSIWENKRSKGQIKFKGELECDLKVVGIEEGSGKYAGMLGAVICESADGVIKVSVGSGFSDEQRKMYNSDLIGSIVSVKYNARIKNKSGDESLFLPIFIEVRYDKSEADYSNSVS